MGYYGTGQTPKWFKDRRTVADSRTTPPVTSGALCVLLVENLSTNTKRNQGRSLSAVHASVPCEVSNKAVHMKGNACPLERRKFTVRMVVVCATSAFGKRSSEPFWLKSRKLLPRC